jgi:hypothetical protein
MLAHSGLFFKREVVREFLGHRQWAGLVEHETRARESFVRLATGETAIGFLYWLLYAGNLHQ